MSGLARALLIGAISVVSLGVFGFLVFAAVVTRDFSGSVERADAIVALTGGERRISEAGRLLRVGAAGRLLISGVNPKTTRADVRRLTGLSDRLYSCCVDLGYEARDTVGNADEARDWVRSHGFKSLIVVTASYHMPRSLAELGQVLPEIRLVPHPVIPTSLENEPWWLHFLAARILIGEYVKFLPAAARYALFRLWPGEEGPVTAERAPRQGSVAERQ